MRRDIAEFEQVAQLEGKRKRGVIRFLQLKMQALDAPRPEQAPLLSPTT